MVPLSFVEVSVNTNKPKSSVCLALVSAAGVADVRCDVAVGVVGVAAQRGDRRDADDDDEGQHDRVLDGGRAVFVLQKTDQVLTELTHGRFPWRSRVYLCIVKPTGPESGRTSLTEVLIVRGRLTSWREHCRPQY